MRVCEICGAKEEEDTKGDEEFQSVILHVCESCREDRKWSHYENWAF
jgi:ribosome-binding protein aMBF1 (putative translation factor)